MQKLKILLFVDYFLPGYKNGGPIRSISNLIKEIGGQVDIWVVTRDRDIGDEVPYHNVITNEWVFKYGAHILYLPTDKWSFKNIKQILKTTDFNVLYLNSFFSPRASIYPTILNRFSAQPIPIIIAPRGELSKGALSLKKYKKKLYLLLAKLFCLYTNAKWHATSSLERDEIVKLCLTNEKMIFVASNVPNTTSFFESDIYKRYKNPGTLSAVFFSRISKMKNLDFLLRALNSCHQKITLDIYGPIEDKTYWNECLLLIDKLPDHIKVKYMGELIHDDVLKTLVGYDIFLFPTRGENYGHVIAESLSVGTPVMVSDKTPWESDGSSALSIVKNVEYDWAEKMDEWSLYDSQQLHDIRLSALRYYTSKKENKVIVESYINMFSSSIAG
jgi:glycosyltransferase involved in cell wall biosynthesis